MFPRIEDYKRPRSRFDLLVLWVLALALIGCIALSAQLIKRSHPTPTVIALPAPYDAIDGALSILESENDGTCDKAWLESGAVAFNLFISPSLAALSQVCRMEGCDEASLRALMARVDALTTAAYMCTATPEESK